MSANRKEILELLASGKISAIEAAELLSNAAATAVPEVSPKASTATPLPSPQPPAIPADAEAIKVAESPRAADQTSKPSWFRVRVKNLATGKNKVAVNLPLGMMKFGLKLGRQFTPELEGFDWDQIENLESGMLVEVEDEESNEQVQIFLE